MSKGNQTAEYKATEYMYDLRNTALENGFKADELWEVSLSTAEEKNAIEKQYYPTVATFISPEHLNAAFKLVKGRLEQAINEQIVSPKDRYSEPPVYQYLVAYIPARVRR